MSHFKHLVLEDRITIQSDLHDGLSFKKIASHINHDCTTVSSEIRNHLTVIDDMWPTNRKHNRCIHYGDCKKRHVCNFCQSIKNNLCKYCDQVTCSKCCPDYKEKVCDRLSKAPYVCNGCPMKINHCTIAHKYRYDARFADRKYRELLSSSRAGINMTRHQLHQKDQIVTPLIAQGQSPYQILINHPELDMSVRSMYTYIDKGLFTARNVDLKRQAKFKPRKCHKTQIKDREVFTNRTYADFCSLELNSYVQMDTVKSSRDSQKTLLTMIFTEEKLFLAFLINRCTKGAVRAVFDRLEKRMGTYEFTSVFENILTDRGSEFGNPEELETGITGIQRSSIYYCDPMRSGQKGTIEQAHTMLRMILPKGTSFEFLTQWDVNLIVNHINSTPRESLDGKTPYDAALETLGEDVLKAFQLKPISPDEVNLTPKLIRFKK